MSNNHLLPPVVAGFSVVAVNITFAEFADLGVEGAFRKLKEANFTFEKEGCPFILDKPVDVTQHATGVLYIQWRPFP